MGGTLGEVEAAVDAVLTDPLWSLSDDEVSDETCRMFTVMQRLSARFAALVGEAGVRQIPRAAGAATPTAWLAGLLAMSGSEAHRWVKLAGLLHQTPAVSEALAAGEVSAEQARVIAQTVHDLPAQVGDAGRDRAVAVLTGLAAEERLRPEVLARHRETILETVAPEVAEERLRRELERAERGAYERRHFTMSRTGEGEYRLRGVFDAEMAAIVAAALDPLCKPTTATATGAGSAEALGGNSTGGIGSANGSGSAEAFGAGAAGALAPVRTVASRPPGRQPTRAGQASQARPMGGRRVRGEPMRWSRSADVPSTRANCPTTAARNPTWSSPCPGSSCVIRSAPDCWTPETCSPRKRYGGSPATRW